MKRTLVSSVPYSDSQKHQPLGWNSEFKDNRLYLAYYNYHHYNPQDGRWINRDPIGIQGGYQLYGFVENKVRWVWDLLGLNIPTFPNVSTGGTTTQTIKSLIITSGITEVQLITKQISIYRKNKIH